jgi:hypothetical protein
MQASKFMDNSGFNFSEVAQNQLSVSFSNQITFLNAMFIRILQTRPIMSRVRSKKHRFPTLHKFNLKTGFQLQKLLT